MKRKLSFLARSVILIWMLVAGGSSAWAADAHFYLIGQFTGGNWSENQKSHMISQTLETSKYYIEVDVTNGTTYSFALYNGTNQYGPSADGTALPSIGETGDYVNNAWTYTASATGKIKVCVDESSNEWYPWVWIETTAGPTTNYYLKHDWNGEGWSWQGPLTSNGDGTYSFVKKYGGTGCNWNTSASDAGAEYIASPTLVGSPANGDDCTFTLNPSDGTITITKVGAASTTYNLVVGSDLQTENTTGLFTVDLTSEAADKVVSFRIDGVAYKLETAATISAAGTTNYTVKPEDTPATAFLTLTKGLIYYFTIQSNGSVSVRAVDPSSIVDSNFAYYLVGNFFDDDGNTINYNRRYFKFNIQSDGRYMVEIPAAVTAQAQILGVSDDDYHFGPASTVNLSSTHPTTDLSVTGTFASVSGAKGRVKGTTNCWNLNTRNDNTTAGDDDGLYEVWFTAGADGKPTNWEFKHVSKRRVAYFLSDATGATVNPVYNERNGVSSAFSNKTYAMVYIDPAQAYYTIGYVLRDKEWDYINKANTTGAYGAHVNNKCQDVLPTTNKLFLMGNNGRVFEDHPPYNEVSPHVAPIQVNKVKGLYKVEYNPSNGNNEWAKGAGSDQPNDEKNTVGIRGQIIFKSGGEDDPIFSISMVGNAIPGTTDSDGKWIWDSTVGDMAYDENDGCYKLTFTTTADESVENRFRFVANHNKNMTWYEDGTTDDKKAHVPYLETGSGHSCLPTDPNPVSYTVTDNTDDTDVNIIFNRPAGTWTVRFYIDINEQGQKSYRYTITGEETITVLLTFVKDKFIRTFSHSENLNLGTGLKAYEAYKFTEPDVHGELIEDSKKDIYGNCRVYLRQLTYIPANMGVVLVGNFSGTEGEQKKYKLTKRTSDIKDDPREVWVRYDDYVTNKTQPDQPDQWNNFLVPTVEAVNNLGNAAVNDQGQVTYRYFGLHSYYNTIYHKSLGENDPTEDYIGFFRLTESGKSGANKAYLSIPSRYAEADGWTEEKQKLYGVLNFNAQLSGQVTDEAGVPSLAKAMILFDDIDFVEDDIVSGITTVKAKANNNAYYNMQGVRMLAPTKGLYIVNGKKIVIK